MCAAYETCLQAVEFICVLSSPTWPLEALLKGLNGLRHNQVVSAWNQTIYPSFLSENSMRMYALLG